ncbi:MAG: FAD binding domain-containing protein, partial [Thermomicrobiaceae bacterium]|nr:FAD binding domain-containing protein [Thermomicrobiaceae bacterium]
HADPAAELPAILSALDGQVVARGPAGQRVLAAEAFFVSYLTTALAPDEMVTEVRFPTSPPRTGHAWLEVARRHGDYALVGLGAVVALDASGAIADARLALTGVGPTPIRLRAVEERLRGERPGAGLFAEAGRLVARAIEPESDLHASAEYRRHVAGILTIRGLEEAARQALGADRA